MLVAPTYCCQRYGGMRSLFFTDLKHKTYNMENLKALVFGKQLTDYQKALAQREFKGMAERLELLEKAVKNNAVLPHVSLSAYRADADGEEVIVLAKNIADAMDKLTEYTCNEATLIHSRSYVVVH